MARNPSVGNPGPWAASAINEGLTATEGLQALREGGWGVNTQAWYRAYSEAKVALANAGPVAALDPFAIPPGDAFADWSAGREGAFGYQVAVTTIDAETGMMSTDPYTVITDQALTPAEAAQQAFDDYTDADSDAIYGRTTVGAVTVNLYRMTGSGGL